MRCVALLSLLLVCSPSCLVEAACQWLAIENGSNIRGGRSVSLDGNFVAVGDPQDGVEIESPVVPGLVLPDASGRARVYDISNPQNWIQVGQDIAGEEAGFRLGFSVSLASNGTLLAVGTPDAMDQANITTGRVQVYERNGGNQWTPLGASLYGTNESMRFGHSVALSSSSSTRILAVGANQYARLLPNGDTSEATGLVQVFQYNGTAWAQVGKDFIGDRANDELGNSVALSADGTTLAMSSSRTQSMLKNALSEVFEFNDNTTNWKFVGSFTGGRSSLALSPDGSVVAGGDVTAAPSNTTENVGNVKVYKLPGPGSVGLVQLGTDLEGSQSSDGFGASVSLSQDGSIMVAGASIAESGGADYVSVFKFDEKPNSTLWVPIGDNLEGESDSKIFGNALSISRDGSTFVTGGDSLSLYTINDVGCLEDPTIVVPTMAPVATTAPPPTEATTSTTTVSNNTATTTSLPLGTNATTTTLPMNSSAGSTESTTQTPPETSGETTTCEVTIVFVAVVTNLLSMVMFV